MKTIVHRHNKQQEITRKSYLQYIKTFFIRFKDIVHVLSIIKTQLERSLLVHV